MSLAPSETMVGTQPTPTEEEAGVIGKLSTMVETQPTPTEEEAGVIGTK